MLLFDGFPLRAVAHCNAGNHRRVFLTHDRVRVLIACDGERIAPRVRCRRSRARTTSSSVISRRGCGRRRHRRDDAVTMGLTRAASTATGRVDRRVSLRWKSSLFGRRFVAGRFSRGEARRVVLRGWSRIVTTRFALAGSDVVDVPSQQGDQSRRDV